MIFFVCAGKSGKIMIARTIFYPSLLYNIVMERFTSRRWFDRIDDGVVLGALPLRSVTDEVAAVNNVHCFYSVSVVCNVCSYFIKYYETHHAPGTSSTDRNYYVYDYALYKFIFYITFITLYLHYNTLHCNCACDLDISTPDIPPDTFLDSSPHIFPTG